MNPTFKAQIKWLSKEQGGRNVPPPVGSRFGSIIVAKNERLNSKEACWSLIIEINEKTSELETVARVNYLSEEAPNKLKKNFKFDLYDGNKLVAEGIIL